MDPEDDPILRQRARALALANLGQTTGYVLLMLAMVVFVVGVIVGLEDWMTTVIVVLMAVAALVLGPSIILGYAAKAADRFEKTGKTGH
ncbi:MAG: hypothetical protein Q8K63_06385 [Acidimicrobiales bacterium]|nr:hypothetical protein [Acidimicrobiales bacterium]